MSAGKDDDSGEKSHAPTQKRRDDARKKGESARSADAATAGSYLGFMLLLFILSGGFLKAGLAHLTRIFEFAGDAAFDLSSWAYQPLIFTALLLSIPTVAVVLVHILTGAVTLAPQVLKPKLSRINPIAQAKQKFGLQGMVEFLKTFTKMMLIAIGLTLILQAFLPRLLISIYTNPGQIALGMGTLVWQLTIMTTGIALVIGVIDFFWQRYTHTQKLRMSHRELRDENKETDGNPQLKAERRQRAEEMATNRMLTDMVEASVVMVNPTRYAVALKWSVGDRRAPICVAKGTNEIAAKIRSVAAEHGIPIRHDPPTARALFATVDLGAEIPRDMYHAVAAALRYAQALRQPYVARSS